MHTPKNNKQAYSVENLPSGWSPWWGGGWNWSRVKLFSRCSLREASPDLPPPLQGPLRTINRPQGPPEHSQVLPAGHLSAELICPSLTGSAIPAAVGQRCNLAAPGGWHLGKQTLSFGCCWESQGIRIGENAGVGGGVKSKPPVPVTHTLQDCS